MSTSPAPRAARYAAALLMVAALLGSSCSDSDRPAVDEWRPRWTEIVGSLPEQADLGGADARTLCNDALAYLRSTTPDLSPTPDPAIDDVVTDWIRVAEDAFFECPPRGGEIASFDDAYAELERLEAEVAVVLEIDEG